MGLAVGLAVGLKVVGVVVAEVVWDVDAVVVAEVVTVVVTLVVGVVVCELVADVVAVVLWHRLNPGGHSPADASENGLQRLVLRSWHGPPVESAQLRKGAIRGQTNEDQCPW